MFIVALFAENWELEPKSCYCRKMHFEKKLFKASCNSQLHVEGKEDIAEYHLSLVPYISSSEKEKE